MHGLGAERPALERPQIRPERINRAGAKSCGDRVDDTPRPTVERIPFVVAMLREHAPHRGAGIADEHHRPDAFVPKLIR